MWSKLDRLAKATGVSRPKLVCGGALGLVVGPPELDRRPGRRQTVGQMLVEAFVPQPAVRTVQIKTVEQAGGTHKLLP